MKTIKSPALLARTLLISFACCLAGRMEAAEPATQSIKSNGSITLQSEMDEKVPGVVWKGALWINGEKSGFLRRAAIVRFDLAELNGCKIKDAEFELFFLDGTPGIHTLSVWAVASDRAENIDFDSRRMEDLPGLHETSAPPDDSLAKLIGEVEIDRNPLEEGQPVVLAMGEELTKVVQNAVAGGTGTLVLLITKETSRKAGDNMQFFSNKHLDEYCPILKIATE